MKILNKLTIRNLKLNRTRTLVAMFGIILATSLIAVTVGLFSSFYTTLIRHVESDTGAYHVEYYDLTEEQKKELLKDKEIDNYYSTNVIGYSISNLESQDAQFLQIVEYDKNAFKGNKITLLEGELPKNSNEIVIQKKMARYGFDKKVGDEITLDVFDESMYLSYITEYNKRRVEKYNDENDNEEELDNEEIEDIDISNLITTIPNEKNIKLLE